MNGIDISDLFDMVLYMIGKKRRNKLRCIISIVFVISFIKFIAACQGQQIGAFSIDAFENVVISLGICAECFLFAFLIAPERFGD